MQTKQYYHSVAYSQINVWPKIVVISQFTF